MNRKYKNLYDLLKHWFSLVIVITIMSGLVYAAVQQDLRQSANDPQIQMAQDLANQLSRGSDPFSLFAKDKVDIATSLAPYLIVYSQSGAPLVSSAVLDGQTPEIPAGVLDFTRRFGEDRLTWQPKPEVRSAVVVVYYQGVKSGFVLAGRSLREVEKREDKTFLMVSIAWLVAVVATLASTILFS